MAMGPRRITENPDMGLTLSDGTRLSARVWMPEDAADDPVPAIVEYLPYRKRDGTFIRDELTHPWFASHGYACLRIDIRGNGDSQGVMEDEYSARELADAVELIDAIAARDWCSGKVGMMGISWGGFNALQVAALAPAPLKAIITLCSTVDRFADDIHYKGGCMLGRNFGWGATMLSYSSRAPDPAIVGDKWRDMWLERLNAEQHLPALWSQHQHRDDYWKHGSVCEDYSAIKAATLAIGGWGDAYKNAVQSLVENLNAPAKGIIGPWIHKYPHFAIPEPRIGFLQEAKRWWDRWLKDIDTGVEDDPDLRLYLMDSVAPKSNYALRPGRWINQDFRAAPSLIQHLSETGITERPGTFERSISCPADTGFASGEYCAIWQGPDLPGDQRREDHLSLCFDSEKQPHDIAIVGAPTVTLTVAGNAPVAQIAVRLNDVFPDGKSARITYGVLNLCHRDSAENPAAMPVGQAVQISLKLDQIAYTLPAGHRLRLSISNAYWPLIWPAPGKTELIITAGHLELPLLNEAEQPLVPFEPPQSAPAANIRTIRDASNVRETIIDQKTGISALRMVDDFGEIEDLTHGLINGAIAREWWSIHPDDPLSAQARIHYSDKIERADWSVRTETTSEMWMDTETIFLTARIEAYEADKLVFEKDFADQIPRDLI